MSRLISMPLIILTITINAINGTLEEGFTITQLNNSGIFFEKMEETSFYSQSQIILTSIKPQNMTSTLNYLKAGRTQLKNLCAKIQDIDNDTTCRTFIDEIRMHITDIELHNTIINHASGRTRRALLDGVGTAFKYMFGTMDEVDSQNIYQSLQNIHEDEENTFKLVKEQIAVMKSNFDTLKDPIESIIQDIKGIQEQINTINKESEIALNYQNRTNYILFMDERFLEVSNLLLIKCMIINKEQNRLMGIINSVRTNKLHPMIASAAEISKTVREAIQNQKLEVDEKFLTPTNINQIAKINHLEINGTIVIKIEIPLPEKEVYELFKTFTTPIVTNGDWFTYDIEAELIATNHERTQFIMLTEQNTAACTHVLLETNKMKLICKHENQIITNTNRSCCLTLLHYRKAENCKLGKMQKQNRITKLVTGNSWLFILHTPEMVTINCNKSITVIILNNTGIISFNTNCRIYTKDSIIPTYGSKTRNIQIHQPEKKEVFPEVVININQEQRAKEEVKTIKIDHYSNHNENIKRENEKLEKLQNLADIEEKIMHSERIKWRASNWKLPAMSLSTIVVVIIMTLLALKFKSRMCKNRNGAKQAAPIINLTSIQPTIQKKAENNDNPSREPQKENARSTNNRFIVT